jgi:hypothetical protein
MFRHLKNTIYWDVKIHSLVGAVPVLQRNVQPPLQGERVSQAISYLRLLLGFNSEENMFPQIVIKLLDYMTSHIRRQ